MKKVFIAIALFTCCKLWGWELNYGFNSPAQHFSHYSVINSTVNDGLVSAGNAKNTGVFSAHAMKVNYSGTVLWSKNYNFSSLWNTLSYRITNDMGQGYLLTGVNMKNGSPSVFAPFVMRIDESGNPLRFAQLPVNGVGLTIRVCQGGNIMVGGFESETLSSYASSTRVGFLCKLDPNFNIIWYKRITGQMVAAYNNFDHVETVMPIMLNGNECYYVSGGMTKNISTPGVTKTNIVMLSQLYDAAGNLMWNNTQAEDFSGVDAAYNPALQEIYLVSNGNTNTPYVASYYRIDAATGTIMYTKTYEGDVSNMPYGSHITYANKINFINNKVIIYGYSRDFRYNGTGYLNTYIPHRIVTDRDFNTPATTFYMMNTTNYQFGGILGTHGTGVYQSFFTADMGVDFIKDETEHFAVVGYENYMNNTSFSVHLTYDASAADCTPKGNAIGYGDFGTMPILSIGHITMPKPNPPPLVAIGPNLTIFQNYCNLWMDPLSFVWRKPDSEISTKNAKEITLQVNNLNIPFTVDKNATENMSISIYNQLGQLMYKGTYTETANSLNLALDPGFYVIELKSGAQTYTAKLIQ